MFDDPDDLPPDAPDDYEVGYRKPPMVRRFKNSGNPSGRPTGARGRETIIRQIAEEMLTVTEDDQQTSRSTLELVLIRLRNMALEGKNPAAMAEMIKLIEKHEPRKLHPNAGALVVPATQSPEEYFAEAQRHIALMDKHGVRNPVTAEELERQQRKKEQSKKPVS